MEGVEAANPPTGATSPTSRSSQPAAGRGCAALFVRVGRRVVRAQTSPHPKHPQGRAAPHFPASPCTPQLRGLQATRCPELRAERRAERSPPPSEQEETPSLTPTSPRWVGSYLAQGCGGAMGRAVPAAAAALRLSQPQQGRNLRSRRCQSWEWSQRCAADGTGLNWAELGGVRWTGRGIHRERLEEVEVGGIADTMEEQS